MEFRLTYQGMLLGASRNSTRASHKHDIRRVFHRQLKRYWDFHPYLSSALVSHRRRGRVQPEQRLVDHLAAKFQTGSYRFVPLVTSSLTLICEVDILFLRPSMPGEVIGSGDIDNRLKTIFDALRVPQSVEELGGQETPQSDENPFFCLLEDDKLVGKVSVETDTLLEPTSTEAGGNDARLVIAVKLRPFDVGWDNISFG
jgi:hypothetical protein